ncbi:MAG: oligoendopeptidase F [Deltaproteobacteria bacterium]|nr:oligoendopeptidase F [Deltaproteobacteria bacterium]
MIQTINRLTLFVALCVLTSPARASEKTPERGKVDQRYQWKTEHVFKTDAAWERAKSTFVAMLPRLERCRGQLKSGEAKTFKRCLDQIFAQRKALALLDTYARRKHDQDTRVTKYAGYKELMDQVAAKYAAATAYVKPEILSLPKARLEALVKDKLLGDYDQYLRELLRKKPHVLSGQEEALLAKTEPARSAGYNIYSTFSAAELRFPEVKVGDGSKVRLTQALYGRYRASSNRDVRKRVFDAFFGTYKKYRRTMAQMLSAQVQANITTAKIRRHKSALAAALNDDNVPIAVYDRMVAQTNRYLPLLHRYLKLRKRLLKVDQLRYYDMYPPMLDKVELKYPYEKSRQVIAEALAPLGTTYVEILKRGLDPANGWIDVYPNQGKRSGAYMDGDAYDVHPFVLCNHLDTYDSLSTLAHEMGHAVHSWLSNRHQPYPKAGYPIFVAELASTANEALLIEYLLAKERDPKRRLFFLGERLEGFRTTFFRQAMFAEFERAIYKHAEADKPLTADAISKIYAELLKRYYGDNKSVVKIDELYAMEWAYVPHFYYNFYVFQYATGITAATAIAEKIRNEGTAAAERYLNAVIKAGGSAYPLDMLKRAGVDLTTAGPYDVSMGVFKRSLVEAEQLVKKLGL